MRTPRDLVRPWWEPGVIYQVYPRSFQDSNGDGIGELPGIVERLDHLVDLGVDAIWLSPVFRSPMADFGYDISDYCDVDPIFGTLDDLDRLIRTAHASGLKVLLDFVPNHTSSEHPWFIESRSSRDSAKRDWYLWADPRPDGGPPTNWRSVFGGSGWEPDERTGQSYFHSFLREQPDLDWRNPQVRAAMAEVLRFWLDRGIDGFRVDVIHRLIKDDLLRDDPANPTWSARTTRGSYGALQPVYSTDRPEVHEVIAEIRAVLDEYGGDRVLIGEIYLPVEHLVSYYGSHPDGLETHLPFNFQLLELPWRADVIGEAILGDEAALPAHGWPNWVLGNHDRPRIATRVGPDQARVAAMLLLTLRGTPTVYYGDEIGMTDVDIPPDLQQDPARFDSPGGGRDAERTPMRWDGTPLAGFTTGQPWLPIGEVGSVNVADQRADPGSMLSLHRRLIALRRAEPALAVGDWTPLRASDGVLAYERSALGRRLLVSLELSGSSGVVSIPGLRGRILLSTGLDREGEHVAERIGLRPNDGVVVEVTGRISA
jgi:alpha-glucosidase